MKSAQNVATGPCNASWVDELGPLPCFDLNFYLVSDRIVLLIRWDLKTTMGRRNSLIPHSNVQEQKVYPDNHIRMANSVQGLGQQDGSRVERKQCLEGSNSAEEVVVFKRSQTSLVSWAG